ncbi:hypothetical protein V2J09_022237 [Rumex salicifolius]
MAQTSSPIFAGLNPEEERLKIRDISLAAESQSKEGDNFYLITQRWWQHWLDYVNQDKTCQSNDGLVHSSESGGSVSKRPPNIDNSDLIYDTPIEDLSSAELHDTLVEGRDYILLPEEVWIQLKAWYGGGPTLARRVINSGLSQMELAVEVYPLRLKLVLMPKGGRATIRISKKETIAELHRKACEIFDLHSEQVCIWDYYGHQKQALYDMEKSLDDANIQMDQDILVEVLNNISSSASGDVLDNGSSGKESSSGLLEPPKSSVSIAGGLSASKGVSKNGNSELSKSQNPTATVKDTDNTYGTSGVTTRGTTGGLTGLLNLGNTCFMNSAIQCLVHTPEFAKYFQEDYHREINWQNPLGMVGELALAFGELLRRLWAPGRTPIAPRPFKTKLSRFAPQFSGNQQHDSQELLAFLLDGLHEDLNRVKHKPYMKSRDADGRPEEEVADEYWANHRARNDSIIVDVCQGQYKSTLVCPICGKVSVTFDPFMYLSLPLQSTVTRTMTVTVFSTDGSSLPNICTLNVPKQGRCRDLLQILGASCGLMPTEKLLLAEIRNHLVHQFFEDPFTSLATIKDDDHLAAYKVSKFEKETVFIQLIHRREEKDSSSERSKGWKPYGTPLVLPVSTKDLITRGEVQSMVRTMLFSLKKKDCKDDSNTLQGDSTKIAELSHDTYETSTNSSDHCSSIEKDSGIKLPLQLVDENNACINLTVGEEKSIRLSSSSSMLVFIDWSKKLLEKYDTHFLENLREVAKNGPPSKKARSEPLSLYTCLEAFLREEPLVPEDMFCPQCKEQRQASKKLDLWRLPEVLVIHLKRFSYSRSMKHKLETYVNFPVHDFDLTRYIASQNNSERQLYELYALINHYGGMGSGHYTAHIKLVDESKWYNFDDNHISAMMEDEVKSSAAYVLFYRRVRKEDNRPQPSSYHRAPSRR